MLTGSFLLPANAQNDFENAFNDFKQKAETEYEEFRKKANREYADWMRKAWVWHKKMEPMPRPKDDMMPPVIFDKNKKKRTEPKSMPYEEVVPVPEPAPQPKPVAPIRENNGEYKVIYFQFFGTDGQVRLPTNFAFKLNGNDVDAFANGWEELASNKCDNLIRDCLVLRMEHQLCDWAYLMMLGAMSEKVCGGWNNEARMMQGFVLCQSGYKVRFGITKEMELRLLFKSEHQIFDLNGFEMDDGMFYLIEPITDDGLNVCDIAYPDEKALSLWIDQEQLLSENLSEERLLIQADSARTIRVQTNKNWMVFCNSYPTSMIGEDIVSRWAMYANTPISNSLKSKLYPQLQDAIKKYDISDAVNAASWLLYWVQTAFVYEYDDKVWGHDRAFFAEETLYYPYCDCEDRSILYSRLVRDLLGLDVILVFYPGHLATAVAFNSPVDGDYIEFNGKRFTICDPTYIGAPIGETMPDMDNKTAKVILLKSKD
jgi:hypothetical protein